MYFLQCLNGVNIVYDSDLEMSDNVQQLVVFSTMFIISGVSTVQLEYNLGVSFL